MPVETRSRRGLVAPILGLMLVAFLMVAARTQWNDSSARVSARALLITELTLVQQSIEAARDSTRQHIAMTEHLIGWMNQTDESSSMQLIAGLSAVRQAARPVGSLIQVRELAATGRLGVVGDARLRSRLLELERALGSAGMSGESAYERYRSALEEKLSPGMWRFLFYGESGKLPIDYRATMQELTRTGFDRTLRSLLRVQHERVAELEAMAAESAALLGELRATGTKAAGAR